MKFLITFVLASALTSQVYAEDIPKHQCTKPTAPNSQASDMVVKFFNKKLDAYRACIDKFVKEQREQSTLTLDPTTANLHHDAAEAAIKEYNDFMAELNAKAKNDDD